MCRKQPLFLKTCNYASNTSPRGVGTDDSRLAGSPCEYRRFNAIPAQ